jgi:Monogalactosyldiacylglycerol (MGDG) synthase/Glycosyltransferase family 28 C-terminal domain
METIQLLYFDAGGGHRSAATALDVVLQRDGTWKTQLASLQDILDPIDPVRRLTGTRLEDVYNLLLRRGWTRGSEHLLVPLHAAIRRYHPETVRLLEDHWRATRPDFVVSVVPQFNRAISESLHRVNPDTPLVTILTDFADFPPHFWIEPPHDENGQYYICGTERAAAQAVEIGVPSERVLRTSGMIVHPRFYEAPPVDRARERARLGLSASLPTGLVLFGGHGSIVIRDIAERLDESGVEMQLILMCGRNRTLEDDLHRTKSRRPRLVEGFTTEVPYYMQLADFFIGKPGPGSVSEALLMRLPVVVERNARTMPQERYNVEWVLEKGVGLAVKDFGDEIAGAVEKLLQPGVLDAYRRRAAALKNRAVFEIPGLLHGIRSRYALECVGLTPLSRREPARGSTQFP